jgi:poly(3-hydroxybutyrate) depolymerase
MRMLIPALTLLFAGALQGATVPVVEFYHAGLNHYFRTASSAEVSSVENGGAGAGWVHTYKDFLAWPDAASAPGNAAPVCRFYGTPGRGPNSHFYTVSAAECALVKADPGWTYEGTAFFAVPAPERNCPSNLQAVYRNYNNRYAQNDSNHRFSTDLGAYQSMVASGWSAEGVVMCVPKAASGSDDVAYSGSFPASTGAFSRVDLVIAGVTRSAWVYRPGNAANAAFMIFFTGTGGTVESSVLDEMGREAVQAFADANQLAMAFPLPRLMTRGDWDNHSAGTPYWETAVGEATDSAPSSDINANADLVFVRALVAEARRAWNVDASRVYANGFSNGAFFSYFVANVLRDRIAGFAETGGGLVLSNTTAGEPAPCRPAALAGETGVPRSCEASGWTPGTCVAAGAVARPLAATASSGPLPAAFMEANDDDGSVPYAHSCNLAAALPADAAKSIQVFHANGGHGVNGGYLDRSWQFLRAFALH